MAGRLRRTSLQTLRIWHLVRHANPDAVAKHGRVLRGGRRSLIEFWQKQQEAGVSHVMLNVKPTRRTTKEIFEELGTHVLPLFPAQAEPAQVGRA
jgi:hypothetical protein